VVLSAGESIYIDSNMGHAYVAAEGCDEATVLGVCSSDDEEGLMESLMEMHDDQVRLSPPEETSRATPAVKPKARAKKTAA
jgi:hypothetical protein